MALDGRCDWSRRPEHLFSGLPEEWAVELVQLVVQREPVEMHNWCLDESKLQRERVAFLMPLLSLGVRLDLSKHESIVRACVGRLVGWLSFLRGRRFDADVPLCIRQAPRYYCTVILGHLRDLFRPKREHGAEEIEKQVELGKSVLDVLEQIVYEADPKEMGAEIYDEILEFLLSTADSLLAGPTDAEHG